MSCRSSGCDERVRKGMGCVRDCLVCSLLVCARQRVELMPRIRTDAAERTRQNQRLVAEVGAELGRRVTVAEAVAHRRAQRGGEPPTPPGDGQNGGTPPPTLSDFAAQRGNPVGGHAAHLIKDRTIDLTDVEVEYVGTLLAQVEDFRIVRGVTAALTLTTSTDFRHLLVDASLMSRADMLVCDLYRVPRCHGLDDGGKPPVPPQSEGLIG